jgi:hypothetical protein
MPPDQAAAIAAQLQLIQAEMRTEREVAALHRAEVLRRLDALTSVDAETKAAVTALDAQTATAHADLGTRLAKVEKDLTFEQGRQSAWALLSSAGSSVATGSLMLALWYMTGGRTPLPAFGAWAPTAQVAPPAVEP